MKLYIQNLIWGILMAFGELIPGVGMQTIAIIIGIYNELINFLYEGTEFLRIFVLFLVKKQTFKEVQQAFLKIPWKLGLPIMVGVGITIALVSHSVSGLFETYPMQISAAAFGIITASILIPAREIKKKTWKEFAIFSVSFFIFYLFFNMPSESTNTATPSIVSFFTGGIFASFAGFFPGISISFALLVMGLYEPLLGIVDSLTTAGAITPTAIFSMLAFLIGLAIGLLICVRLLEFFIDKYQSYFLSFIVGLIAASLRAVWPFMQGTVPVAPWDVSTTVLLQQLITLFIAFSAITFVRMVAEKKGALATSFTGVKHPRKSSLGV